MRSSREKSLPIPTGRGKEGKEIGEGGGEVTEPGVCYRKRAQPVMRDLEGRKSRVHMRKLLL